MKRLVGTLMAVSLCASGCGSFEAMAQHDSELSELPSHDRLPARLPKAIALELGSVSLVSYATVGQSGSAVQIESGSNNLYVSAGHIFKKVNNTPKSRSNELDNIQIEAPATTKPEPTGGELRGKPIYTIGNDFVIQSLYASFRGETSNAPDISLLEADDCDTQEPKLPQLARHKASIGSDVYFVNYEGFNNSMTVNFNQIPRGPVQQGTLDQLKRDEKYRQPAIYAGVITGFQHNSDYIVRNGIKSYGAINQSVSTHGASGGAVFNAEGQLIGTSVAGTVTGTPLTIVQPISNKLIEHLSAKETSLHNVSGSLSSPVCTL